MLLAEVARISHQVAGTSSRTEKVALLAGLFRAAGPEEVPVVVTYLAGRLPQRRTGIGWKSLSRAVPPADAPSLSVTDVHRALEAIATVSGRGAQAERGRLLHGLLSAATGEEQRFLVRLIGGELRQGALDAFAVEGLAAAVGAEPTGVRRAVMVGGSLGRVAQALLARGPGALADFRLDVGRPVLPMLAQTAGSVDEALDRLGPCAVEEKLDGIRVQVHRDGPEVRVFTRTLDEITGRLPEVVAAARELRAGRAVLDGEVIALGEDGRPRPFQEVAPAGSGRGWTWSGRTRRCRCRPSSSTCCRSTAATCWSCRRPGGTRNWPGWCPGRCGCCARSSRIRGTSGPVPRRGSSPTRCWSAATRA
jgi:DNA ligase-1